MNGLLQRIAQIAEALEEEGLPEEAASLDSALWNISEEAPLPNQTTHEDPEVALVERPINNLVDSIVQRMLAQGVPSETIASAAGQEMIRQEMENALLMASSEQNTPVA